jgi:hypothetical protein
VSKLGGSERFPFLTRFEEDIKMFPTWQRSRNTPPPRVRLKLEVLEDRRLLNRSTDWISFAHDPQHSGLSFVPSQSLDMIGWQTPMDLNFDPGTHEGSPVITAANTVIVPVKNHTNYVLEGHQGSDGTLLWSVPTDYHGSTFAPVLTPANRLYFAGAGGTVYYIDNPDAPGATISGQLAFYGIANHDANLDSTVTINTPLTVDRNGTIYFGFTASPSNDLGLKSGLARMDVNGNGSWISAGAAAGDASMVKVAQSCAPALSNDGSMLYVAVNNNNSQGYLVALDSTTLTPINQVYLRDVKSGNSRVVWDSSSATPMVGPDGDVYYGIEEDPYGSNLYRGWLRHFSSDLSESKIPGAFGWDNTASIVPRSMVPSYTGPSSYLVVTKYNKYALDLYEVGVLDPNTSMNDPYSNVPVMQEVLTVDTATPGREWCINDAAVDPGTDSILVNSEDGNLYRWNLTSNTLSQNITLDAGIGEAYTPTLIGPDGTVYSINDGILFAVQAQAGPVGAKGTTVVVLPSTLSQENGFDVLTAPAANRPAPLSSDMTSWLAVAGAQSPSNSSSEDTGFHPALHQAVQDPLEVQDLFG